MKQIVINLAERTEATGRHGTFPIQVLEPLGSGWYMDRAYVDHPQIRGASSFLLPSRHIWVMQFRAHRGRHRFETYIHACQVRAAGHLLQIDDLYADVIRHWDGRWSVVDLDEMAAAVAAGELTPAQTAAGLRGMEAGIKLLAQVPVGQMATRLRELASAGRL